MIIVLHFDIGHRHFALVLVVFLVDSLPYLPWPKKKKERNEFLPRGVRLAGTSRRSHVGAFSATVVVMKEEFWEWSWKRYVSIVQYQMDNGRGLFVVSYIVAENGKSDGIARNLKGPVKN
jgi:hypothetical protein